MTHPSSSVGGEIKPIREGKAYVAAPALPDVADWSADDDAHMDAQGGMGSYTAPSDVGQGEARPFNSNLGLQFRAGEQRGETPQHEPYLKEGSAHCKCGWPKDGVPRRWHQVDEHIRKALEPPCDHVWGHQVECVKCRTRRPPEPISEAQPLPARCDARVNVSREVSGHGFGYGTHNCQLEKGHLGFHRIGQITWFSDRLAELCRLQAKSGESAEERRTLMSDKYEGLRRAAEKATLGPYTPSRAACGKLMKLQGGLGKNIADLRYTNGEADTAYFAAASPDVILSLLQEREQLLGRETPEDAWRRGVQEGWGMATGTKLKQNWLPPYSAPKGESE